MIDSIRPLNVHGLNLNLLANVYFYSEFPRRQLAVARKNLREDRFHGLPQAESLQPVAQLQVQCLPKILQQHTKLVRHPGTHLLSFSLTNDRCYDRSFTLQREFMPRPLEIKWVELDAHAFGNLLQNSRQTLYNVNTMILFYRLSSQEIELMFASNGQSFA